MLLRSEYENTKISHEFEENNKPVSAAYTCRSSDIGNTVNGTISFNYLVDYRYDRTGNHLNRIVFAADGVTN